MQFRVIPLILAVMHPGCVNQRAEQLPPWEGTGVPVHSGGNVNGSTFDGGPSLALDGLSLYFTSDRTGGLGGADIWSARRTGSGAQFAAPTNAGEPLNSDANESAPDISADGLALLFDSDRTGGFGSYDLWIATRSRVAESFGPPRNLGAGVNSDASDGHPHLSRDGLRLYFQSRRPSGFGDADLWLAVRTRVSDAFDAAVNLGSAVNSRHFDGEPTVSSDGLVLIFSSDRPGGCGRRDLWAATRARVHENFDPPRHLGCLINSAADDVTPSLSRDGSSLYFMSDRPGGLGSFDIWMIALRDASAAR